MSIFIIGNSVCKTVYKDPKGISYPFELIKKGFTVKSSSRPAASILALCGYLDTVINEIKNNDCVIIHGGQSDLLLRNKGKWIESQENILEELTKLKCSNKILINFSNKLKLYKSYKEPSKRASLTTFL